MKVRELIQELEKCNSESNIAFFIDFDNKIEINDISYEDSEGDVVLGNDLPCECHARHYMYER